MYAYIHTCFKCFLFRIFAISSNILIVFVVAALLCASLALYAGTQHGQCEKERERTGEQSNSFVSACNGGFASKLTSI